MSAEQYRETLRSLSPRVYVGGELIASVADEPRLDPGVNAVGITYDFALVPDYAGIMVTPGLSG